MKINSLELRNFKGLKNLEINPQGEDINIYGENGTGKTTIFDAFTWLLFDKDSNNSSNFNIKTLDSLGQVKSGLEHEVKASLYIQDKTVELQKIYKEKWTKKRGEADKEMTGHETDYFIDGVPKKKKEFTEFLNSVIDEETFRILTNPLHFNTKLDWKKRREVALQLVGEVDETDVINSNDKLRGLENLLVEDTTAEDLKAKTQATKRKLNKQLEQIPIRIDELSRQDIDEDADFSILEEEKKNIEKEIETIRSSSIDTERIEELKQEVVMLETWKRTFERDKTVALNESYKKVNKEIQDMQQKINSLLRDKQRKESEGELIDNKISLKNESLKSLREEYKSILNLEFDLDENTCKSCGQELQEEKKDENLEKFNLFKMNQRNKNIEIGKKTKKEIEKLEFESQVKFEDIFVIDLKIEKLTDQLNEFNEELNSIEKQLGAIDFNSHEQYRETDLKIENLNKEIESLLSSNKEKTLEQQNKLSELQIKLNNTNTLLSKKEVLESNLKRVEELKEEERELAEQVAQLEKLEIQCEQFVVTKAQLLEDKLNDKFKLVKFKLFNKQINGGVDETFVTTVCGVPFDDLNTAMRVNAGLDIISTLSKHYKMNMVIFIDNRESITEITDIDSQIINLIVSDDKELRIEQEKTEGVA